MSKLDDLMRETAERNRKIEEKRRQEMTFIDKVKEKCWIVLKWFFMFLIAISFLYECKGIFIKSVDDAQEGDYMEHILDKVP
jgi:hypothetical protein